MIAMRIDDLPNFHPFLDYFEGPNLLTNPSAESAFSGWTISNNTDNGSATIDSSEVYNASSSFKLNNLDNESLNLQSDEIYFTSGTRVISLSG
jgi:hypothetical protein